MHTVNYTLHGKNKGGPEKSAMLPQVLSKWLKNAGYVNKNQKFSSSNVIVVFSLLNFYIMNRNVLQFFMFSPQIN